MNILFHFIQNSIISLYIEAMILKNKKVAKILTGRKKKFIFSTQVGELQKMSFIHTTKLEIQLNIQT